MSEVDVILAALTAGAAAGTSAAARSEVLDAYTGLSDLLRRALTGQGRPDTVLDAVQAEPGTWQTQVGEALTGVGADRDTQVLAAARALLATADPGGTAAGKYQVDVRDAKGVQVGEDNVQHVDDHSVHVGTSYGVVAAEMTGPVHISYGRVLDPPAQPGA